jgi:hypothetical protein
MTSWPAFWLSVMPEAELVAPLDRFSFDGESFFGDFFIVILQNLGA